jgi:hypothetical protein
MIEEFGFDWQQEQEIFLFTVASKPALGRPCAFAVVTLKFFPRVNEAGA